MRKVKYFEHEIPVEEYIKIQICKNAGTQSFAYKDQLCDLCEKMGITYSDKSKKDELFDLLIAAIIRCLHKNMELVSAAKTIRIHSP